MSLTTIARAGFVAAALTLGGLAAPALAAPLGPDTGLTSGPDGIVAVHYGRGYGRHHGFGHRHHGFGRGRFYGGHHFGFRHHHHGRRFRF